VTGLLEPVYRAVESRDLTALTACLRADAFVLTPEAAGVLASYDEVVAVARDRLGALTGTELRIDVDSSVSGTNASGSGAWVFDQIVVQLGSERDVVRAKVRVTALLANDEGQWQVAA